MATQASATRRRSSEFVGQALGELGATLNAALVVIGDRLGLYKAMAGAGPLTPAELARAHRHRPSATCASGSTPRPPAATSPTTPTARYDAARRSTPSRSPTRTARRSCPAPSS